MTLNKTDTVTTRRKEIEKQLHVALSHIGSFSLDEKVASTRHCENMIGATQVPVGVAGPLRLRSVQALKNKDYFIPLATTEGALVASVNRGCKVITESGGAIVDSCHVGSTRGPVFYTKNLEENDRLNMFLETHLKEMQHIARSTSSHIFLTKTFSQGVGQYHYVRFIYDTKDAMGLNMVTIATDKITKFIEEKTDIACISLSGNYCVDKKPSWLNFIEGRGSKVWAEVVIPERVLKKILKTTAKGVYDVWLSKCMMGSIMSGAMGYNAQFANVLAAMFLATGQDIAHIAECGIGVTNAEIRGKSLYISVYLPDLMVGTIGGGTELATQKEALQILDVYGGEDGKNRKLLIEIIGAAVLAGEISLLASLSEGTLAKAHQKLARGKTS
ncbi:MAG: hydroxymethylglutaryl-CoA reductase [Candidatus Gottesmanbacteria bacterium]